MTETIFEESSGNVFAVTNAIGLLREQWGSGQVRIRVIVDRDDPLNSGT
jgi:hypothetical protein